MTEEEWLTCADPTLMQETVRGKVSGRKARLFLVACCGRIWGLLDSNARRAVNVAERHADGDATDRERRAARNAVAKFEDGVSLAAVNARYAAFDAVEKTPMRRPYRRSAATHAARAKGSDGVADPYRAVLFAEERTHADVLRCIFGPLPFRPVTFAPSWRTPPAVALAEAMYQSREFDRMPVLADALEEAGCNNAEVLAHCRSGGIHVRGCWVVDLVLGKE